MANRRVFDIIFKTKGTDKAQRDIGDVDNKIVDLAGSAKKTATILGTALAATTVAVGLKAVKTASQFEMLKARLVGLTGSQKEANRLFKEFNDIAQDTPFSVQEVIDAGATLEAFGLDSEALLVGIADLASFMQVDMAVAAQNFGRAMNAGSGAADMFRDKGINNMIAGFADVKNVTDLTLPEYQEALKKFIIDPSEKVAGAAKIMSETLEGKISNSIAAIDTLAGELGNEFLPTIKDLVGNFTSFVDLLEPEDLINYAQSVGIVTIALGAYTVAQNAANISATAFKKALPVIVLSTIVVGVKNVIDKFKELGEEAQNAALDVETPTENLKQFQDRINSLAFKDLMELVDKFGLFSETMHIVREGTGLTSDQVAIVADRYIKLTSEVGKAAEEFEGFNEIVADTSKIEIFSDDDVERFSGINNQFETFADRFEGYSETLLNNLTVEQQQADLRNQFIKLYPEEAKKLGILTDKQKENAKSMKNNIDLSNHLATALGAAFDPNQSAGEAFQGFIINVMTALQGVIIASGAVSSALATTWIPGLGLAASIAAIAVLEAAKAGVRDIRFAEFGMDEMVSQPTLIMAGEAGPERVNITPASRPSSGQGGGGMTINFLGPVTNKEFVRDTILPEIDRVQKLGLA
jgi:hypothetical protein